MDLWLIVCHTMRAVVYTRISLDRTGEELGITRQREDCAALVAQRGWTLAAVVEDNDTSAAGKARRPGFETVLTGIEQDEFDAVVSWNLDRITRSRRDTVRLIETGQQHGTVIALVRGSDYDLSTPAGQMTADILASVARNEIEVKGDRQRRAVQQAAEAGKPSKWSHRPFGYRDDRITLDPVEAAAVRDACEQILSGGTIRSIATQWTAQGLKPPQGATTFGTTTVRSILLNPRIAGLSRYKGDVVGRGEWQPLVGEDTWRAVSAILTDPGRAPRRGGRTLLGGLVLCPCGALCFGSSNSRKRIYRCRALRNGPGGEHVARVARPVDDYVTRVVIGRLSEPDARELLVVRDLPDVGELRGEARELRARLDSVADEFADGVLTGAQVRRITERVRGKLELVERKLTDAQRKSVLSGLIGAGDVRAVWDGLDLDRQRAVIDTLMTVTIKSPGRGSRVFDPETVTVGWKVSS